MADPNASGVQEMSPGRYIATRFPTLKPPMKKAPNPFSALALLSRKDWLFFAVSEMKTPTQPTTRSGIPEPQAGHTMERLRNCCLSTE